MIFDAWARPGRLSVPQRLKQRDPERQRGPRTELPHGNPTGRAPRPSTPTAQGARSGSAGTHAQSSIDTPVHGPATWRRDGGCPASIARGGPRSRRPCSPAPPPPREPHLRRGWTRTGPVCEAPPTSKHHGPGSTTSPGVAGAFGLRRPPRPPTARCDGAPCSGAGPSGPQPGSCSSRATRPSGQRRGGGWGARGSPAGPRRDLSPTVPTGATRWAGRR